MAYQCLWCRDLTSVKLVQDAIISKFSMPLYEIEIEDITLKRTHLDVGDAIIFSADGLYAVDGLPLTDAYWKIISVRPDLGTGKVTFRCQQIWYGRRKGIDPFSLSTLNPLDKGTQVTLTNGDLTAEQVSAKAWASVRGTLPIEGKKYFEVVDGNYPGAFGVVNPECDLSNGQQPWTLDYAWMVIYSSGDPYQRRSHNSVDAAALNNSGYGGIKRIAINTWTGQMWYGINTGWISKMGDPAGDPVVGTYHTLSGLAGVLYPVVSVCAYGDYSWEFFHHPITINFGATPFTYEVPEGYN
jgi:hypothetical protein